MSSLAITILTLLCFLWGFRYYSRKLAILWQIDPKRATPAYSKYDSVDYIPAKNCLVLFGHHFSSIAGAGPIIGPVIAVILWGWAPALAWIILGSVFFGGMHDFGCLVTSIREGGSSVAEIARHTISRRAKIIFSLFVWLALILVIAVFAYLCAETFVKQPKIVPASLGLIPVAILTGYLLYSPRANSLLATILGLVLLIFLIILGNSFSFKAGLGVWLAVLFIYCFAAAVMPVNILLQPRDYLCSFLLFFGMAIGYLGILTFSPKLTLPVYTRWDPGEGMLWPMLCVTIACGAISGFHALIASGTTSKQIANERHARIIGYGGMLTEGLVAVLALICAACLFAKGETTVSQLKALTPIDVFSRGYGLITKGTLGGYGEFLAMVILNSFILTTLDTATRISRYLSEELFMIKNRYLSTIVTIAFSAALAFSGKWSKIWPVFGAANQLVAALALFVLSCWLLSRKRKITLVIYPALLMFITSLAALVFQAIRYYADKDVALFLASLILIFLSAFMAWETAKAISSRRKAYA